MKLLFIYRIGILSCIFLVLNSTLSKAYSVFAHEAVIDATWEKYLKPALKERFPDAADTALKTAHAYAYGGSLVADMGYFPFGNVYFTNLAHYVRSGDFVDNLINESQNIYEYAFALGALSHYVTDKYGHSLATNLAVPVVYPKMRKKYGNVVTYDDDHTSHSRMEFAFDVIQTAKGNYSPQAYHDFIGFKVAKPVLERAFLKTYGQPLTSVFSDLDLTIGTFRWTVKNLLPGLTRTAWALKRSEIEKMNPGITGEKFRYKMNRRLYYTEYGFKRQKPHLGAEIFALVLRVMPKVGPLKAFKFKPPGPEGEKLFANSFDTIVVHYSNAVASLKNRKADFPDIDFDTGKRTEPEEYDLTDITYGQLVVKLDEDHFKNLTPSLRKNILNYYSKADIETIESRHPKDWKKTAEALRKLRAAIID